MSTPTLDEIEAELKDRFGDRFSWCGNCRFWNHENAHWVYTSDKRARGTAGCHRFPPQIDSDGDSIWPFTAHNSWCGEYVED